MKNTLDCMILCLIWSIAQIKHKITQSRVFFLQNWSVSVETGLIWIITFYWFFWRFRLEAPYSQYFNFWLLSGLPDFSFFGFAQGLAPSTVWRPFEVGPNESRWRIQVVFPAFRGESAIFSLPLQDRSEIDLPDRGLRPESGNDLDSSRLSFFPTSKGLQTVAATVLQQGHRRDD